AAVKRDHLVALSSITSEFDGTFDRFRAGVAEENFLLFRARQGLADALCQIRQTLVIKIRAGHVDQLGRLLLNRVDDSRMAVAVQTKGEARREIEKSIAIDILDHGAPASLGNERVVARK